MTTRAPRVWLLSSGSYSNYNVHAVFATKALAEQAAATLNSSRTAWADYEVEERSLYDAPISLVELWTVRATLRDGLFFHEEPFRKCVPPWEVHESAGHYDRGGVVDRPREHFFHATMGNLAAAKRKVNTLIAAYREKSDG